MAHDIEHAHPHTQSVDTTPEAERLLTALLRGASVAQRASQARSLSRMTIALARRAIQRRQGQADEQAVGIAFVALHYGDTSGRRLARELAGRERRCAMQTPDNLLAVTPVVEAFERLGVLYFVGGSLASSSYGFARATLDVDLIADLRADQVDALVATLQADYDVDAPMIQDAIQRRASFNVIHLPTMLKVDVFVTQARAFDAAAFQRARRDTLDVSPDAHVFSVASPEDIILAKLDWYRMGGEVSERQWSDVQGILKVQDQALDFTYLRQWATTLGLADLLRRALDTAGIPPIAS